MDKLTPRPSQTQRNQTAEEMEAKLGNRLKTLRVHRKMLGKKTMENEILPEAVEYGREKNG